MQLKRPPRSNEVGGATRVGNGQSDIDYLITAGDEGFQVLIGLADRDSSHQHTFDVNMPAGAILAEIDDGSIDIIGQDGISIGTFETPWAKDASGVEVATSYTIQGNSIIQSIDSTGDAVYPIVADPKFTWEWATGIVYFSWETEWLCFAGIGGIYWLVTSPFWLPILLLVAALIVPTACKATLFGVCVKVKSTLSVKTYGGGYARDGEVVVDESPY